MAQRPRDLYELWDFESGNLLGAYDTESEALVIVRATIDQYGTDAVQSWGLGHERRSNLKSLLQGEALADRALEAISAGSRHSGAAD